MNETFLAFASAFQNTTTTMAANQSESLSQTILLIFNKIAEVSVSTYTGHGFWKAAIFFCAIIGFFSILSAIIGRTFYAIALFFKIFVMIPIILVVNLINKKKRKERLKAWGEFKKDLKKQDKKVSKKMWFFWFFLKILSANYIPLKELDKKQY